MGLIYHALAALFAHIDPIGERIRDRWLSGWAYYHLHTLWALVLGVLTVPLIGGAYYLIRELVQSDLKDKRGWRWPLAVTAAVQLSLTASTGAWSLWGLM